MKKKNKVMLETGIEDRVVFLKIHAHDDVMAGRYLAALNGWVESSVCQALAKMSKEKGND